MLQDPHPSQEHPDLHHTVFLPQQETAEPIFAYFQYFQTKVQCWQQIHVKNYQSI